MEPIPSFVDYGFRRVLITFVCLLCIILSVMNASMISVAIYDLHISMGKTNTLIRVVLWGYSLAHLIIIPLSSRLSQLLGRSNYLITAILFFTIGSFLCGNAASAYNLLAFRFLQGLGGAGMLVMAHTILTESWPMERRVIPQILVILGLLGSAAIAPPLGGYLTDNYSWPYIFFANIPAGIITGVLVLTTIKNKSYEKTADRWTTLFKTPGFVAGLILCFIVTAVQTATSLSLSYLFGSRQYLSVAPLGPVVCTIIGTLAVTTFFIMLTKNKGLWYAITAGLILFIISGVMYYNMADKPRLSPFIIRSTASALLSLSLVTLLVSRQEGKQIGHAIALYHFITLLGSITGIMYYYG